MVTDKLRRTVAIMLPDLRAGGAERVCVMLARELTRMGIDVHFVLMRAEGELLNQIPARSRIVDLQAPRFRNLLWPAIKYFRTERPDAVLAAMWPLTGTAMLAKKLSRVGCTIVLAEHTNFSSDPFAKRLSGRLHGYIGRLVYGCANGVVAVSRGVKASLSARTGYDPNRIHVIYNPVRQIEDGVIGHSQTLQWMTSDRPTVVSIGSLKNAKDFPNLLRAFARLRQSRDARLLILGEGSLRGSLESLVASLEISDSVLMPGFVPDPYPYLAHADLFVLSSAWEGLPGVLIEALVAGVPVVSTDCPSGPSEILENGKYGRLVPVGDPEALAAAMAEALDAPHDRDMLRRRGNEFSVERAADQYLALLDPGGKMLAGK
jgi:glycosyltransferase involved in cell wall biosynthesis